MLNCGAQSWPGNGFHINGDNGGSYFNHVSGFANSCEFRFCYATENGYNGLYGYGDNFNICTFYMCYALSNLQAGFRDQGLLGNTFFNCQTSGNERLYNSSCAVSVSASFTGTISGTTLTVSSVTGTLVIGQGVSGTSVLAGTVIAAGSGSSWTVNLSPVGLLEVDDKRCDVCRDPSQQLYRYRLCLDDALDHGSGDISCIVV